MEVESNTYRKDLTKIHERWQMRDQQSYIQFLLLIQQFHTATRNNRQVMKTVYISCMATL